MRPFFFRKSANIILLMGGPATGKTTVAKHFPEFPHISTGDLFRRHLQNDHAKGVELKCLMNKGGLLPDQIVFKALLAQPCLWKSNTVFLDGFPRNPGQLDYLLKYFGQPTALIYLNAKESTMVKNLMERGRPDDNKEAIQERIDYFKSTTQPMINSLLKTRINSLILDGDADPFDLVLENMRTFLIQKSFIPRDLSLNSL